jgi:hypothetical protein
LKYKNGAVVHAPVDGTRYWCIDVDNTIDGISYINDFYDRARLQSKNVFLTLKEAEAHQSRVEIYNKLEKQITIINHENDWVADWSKDKQAKYFLVEWGDEFVKQQTKIVKYLGLYAMCEQAIDWLLSDEVSDNERKIWIEGV